MPRIMFKPTKHHTEFSEEEKLEWIIPAMKHLSIDEETARKLRSAIYAGWSANVCSDILDGQGGKYIRDTSLYADDYYTNIVASYVDMGSEDAPTIIIDLVTEGTFPILSTYKEGTTAKGETYT